MKNRLLLTTALVALVSASNAYAVMTIDRTTSGVEYDDEDGIHFYNVDKPSDLSDSHIKVDDVEIFFTNNSETFEITDGKKIELLNNAAIIADELNDSVKISGGEFSAIGNSQGTTSDSDGEAAIWANGVEISGGNIKLQNGSIKNSDTGTFNMTGGTIDMQMTTGVSNGIGSEGDDTDLNISGGKINVKGGSSVNSEQFVGSNIFMAKNINVSGGEINVESGANLKTATGPSGVENWDSDDDLSVYKIKEKSTIKLTDAGTINLSGGLLANVEGNGVLNVKSSGALVNGNVSGANLTFEADHALSKAVLGTIGDLAALNVNKGTLTYDKQTGKIGSLNVAGGLDIGTQTVNASNVEFKDNSKLALRVAGTDSFGKINADTIKVGNDTTMNVTLDNGVVANGENAKFKFLNGTVDGDFTNKIAENSRYAIEWADDGSLSITGQATASDVVTDAGGSANNAATAEAWDSVTSSSTASAGAKAVASVLGELSQNATTPAGQKAYVDALTAVAPEVAPMVQQTQSETANQVFGAVGTRLTGGSVASASQGMSSGDNIFERAAVWVQGLFNKSKLDDTSKAKGFDSKTYGTAFGIEKQLDRAVKAGVGYAYSKTDIDGFMRDTDVKTHTAIAYGEYKPSNWYVNGIATYGWSDYEEKKSVAGVGVKADYDVETFGLQAMTGYEMNINGLGVTPEAGLRYVHIKQDSYKDSADQRVSANDSDILTGVIGAKVSKNFELANGMSVKPEARVAATYDLMNDDVNSVVTLANGSAYQVNGKALDRFGMEFGAGVTAEVNDKVELSLGYEGKFREDYQDHTGLINAKYKF